MAKIPTKLFTLFFLFRNYETGDDLHVGLVDSQGIVYSYNECGIMKETSGWDYSLCITMIELSEYDEQMKIDWDGALQQSLSRNEWKSSKYDELSYNCYTYVCCMLSEIISVPISKGLFTKQHVLPATRKVLKYVRLYREILSHNGIFVHNIEDNC